MNMEHKTRALALVNELRSGRWEQANGYLRTTENAGCCLGVGCALACKLGAEIGEVMTTVKVYAFADAESVDRRVYEYDGQMHYLPESAQAWYGFRDEQGVFDWLDGEDPIWDRLTFRQQEAGLDGGTGRPALAALNDAGVGFDVIADLIEDEALNGNRRGLFA